jgi:hypothetical protein
VPLPQHSCGCHDIFDTLKNYKYKKLLMEPLQDILMNIYVLEPGFSLSMKMMEEQIRKKKKIEVGINPLQIKKDRAD